MTYGLNFHSCFDTIIPSKSIAGLWNDIFGFGAPDLLIWESAVEVPVILMI